MKYTTINIQGNLISEEILQKVESGEAQGQHPTDFGFEPGTNLRSEIEYAWSRIKLDWKHFSGKSQNLPASDPYGTTLSRRWMEQFLSSLGFNQTRQRSNLIGENNQGYAISHTADNLDDLPMHIVGFHEPDKPEKNTLDIKTSGGTSRLSPHATVQEYLNVTEHLFGLATNGLHLRLIRDSGRLIKLTYVEFDLKRMLDEDKYSEFTLLYRLLHASRFPRIKAEADQCLLEKYYQDSIETGNRIRDGLSQAVKESLVALGNGLLNQLENEHLREAYQNGQLTAYELNHQLLRLIYRLLFLIVTEERDLVYDSGNDSEDQQRKREIYYSYYSLARLRKLSATRYLFESHFTDLWQGLIQTFSFFEPGNKGIKLGIHPLGGELFQPSAIRNIRESLINNRVLLECIKSLNEFEDVKKDRVLINFRSLDVEELGSIYEGLLELAPVINTDGRQYEFNYEKGSERSSSGSHYTPEDLVKPLIHHSLEYLIEDRVQPYYKAKITADAAIQSLLSLKVADVACGSGHILLSAARRIAHEVARIESGEQQPNPQSFRKALKQVIRHCIYGVDKNPLAVELCKVALWLESHNPGEPLNFLDHHIKCGDAIVGLAHRGELEKGIADEAFKTLAVDDKDIAKTWRDKNVKERKERIAKSLQLKAEFEKSTENSVQEAMAEYKTFNQLPETTPDEIERKAKAYKKFIDGKGFTFLKAMADTQVAQFFIPKTEANKDNLMTDADFRLILSGYKGWQDRKVAKAAAVALEQRFFHWFIEFPEVFNEGGFDTILGNPPYLWGNRISSIFGDTYRNYLTSTRPFINGNADFCCHFVDRISTIINNNAFFALITTSSINETDNRTSTLEILLNNKFEISFVNPRIKWPGTASLLVTLLSISKGILTKKFIGSKEVLSISAFLDDSLVSTSPKVLMKNDNKSFKGVDTGGMGFVLVNDEYNLLKANPKNIKHILNYLNADSYLESSNLESSGKIINVSSLSENELDTVSSLKKIIQERVLDYRKTVKDKNSRENWWKFNRPRPNLYSAIGKLKRCLINGVVSKYNCFSFYEIETIFTNAINVFAFEDNLHFTILQSNIHNSWSDYFSSSLGITNRYNPTDCFETFPFPQNFTRQQEQQLEAIGEAYHEHRRQLMLGMQLGLTKTYNLFHSNAITRQSINEKDKQVASLQKHLEKMTNAISFDEAIQGILKLRELHVQMDEAVLDAYGWNDIELKHDFYEVDYLPENDSVRFTIHPDARKVVLKRLLELNHKIHEEELKAGTWAKKKITSHPQKKNTSNSESGFGELFDNDNE